MGDYTGCVLTGMRGILGTCHCRQVSFKFRKGNKRVYKGVWCGRWGKGGGGMIPYFLSEGGPLKIAWRLRGGRKGLVSLAGDRPGKPGEKGASKNRHPRVTGNGVTKEKKLTNNRQVQTRSENEMQVKYPYGRVYVVLCPKLAMV